MRQRIPGPFKSATIRGVIAVFQRLGRRRRIRPTMAQDLDRPREGDVEASPAADAIGGVPWYWRPCRCASIPGPSGWRSRARSRPACHSIVANMLTLRLTRRRDARAAVPHPSARGGPRGGRATAHRAAALGIKTELLRVTSRRPLSSTDRADPRTSRRAAGARARRSPDARGGFVGRRPAGPAQGQCLMWIAPDG